MKINAVDGATLSINGTALPVPIGTTINLRLGNDSNTVVTGSQQNGDGTKTPILSTISGMMEGVVVSITDDALEDYFLELFSGTDHQIVLSNGGVDYSIESGILVSPSADGTPAIESNTRKSEAFNIESLLGKIRRS